MTTNEVGVGYDENPADVTISKPTDQGAQNRGVGYENPADDAAPSMPIIPENRGLLGTSRTIPLNSNKVSAGSVTEIENVDELFTDKDD